MKCRRELFKKVEEVELDELLNVHAKDLFLYFLPSNSFQVLISYVLLMFQVCDKNELDWVLWLISAKSCRLFV